MKLINPFCMTDFYKVGHLLQYPKGTEQVYVNWTPRGSRIPGVDKVVFFGLQYAIKKWLLEYFDEAFFNRNKEDVVREYSRRIRTALGRDLPNYKHIEDLHDLGYLPIRIKALPEGTQVPMRVPCLTIINTKPEFYWLPNFLETLLSSVLWLPMTSATIGCAFREELNMWADMTGMPPEFVQWQGHDFSFRGMSSPESAMASGMGHLLSFTGTDTIPAIDGLELYYGANAEKELIGGSVPATEHSVMCSAGEGNELATFRRLITEVYPEGIVSIVSDTWDLWKVLTEYMPALAPEIMARKGKVVIRPDSGDPVKIICGDKQADKHSPAWRGVVKLLADNFGISYTKKDYKLLDEHVGVIYGDSITLDRAKTICGTLEAMGFASQCVFGIGSYTYQYQTRDTFGNAMKATWVCIDGKGMPIQKDPKTDNGLKKSAKGLLQVERKWQFGDLYVNQECATDEGGLLEEVFVDGKLTKDQSLAEIRERLWS